jgi:hypothetical protein
MIGLSGPAHPALSSTIGRKVISAMTRTSTFAPYLDMHEAARYLNTLGFAAATAETVKYHAYETGKLSRPKILGGRAYWSRESLDALVEVL